MATTDVLSNTEALKLPADLSVAERKPARTDPIPDQRSAQRVRDVGGPYANMRRGDPDRILIIAGWVCALLFPLVGFICGVILTARRRHNHGIWMMVVSGLLMVVSVMMFRAGVSQGG